MTMATTMPPRRQGLFLFPADITMTTAFEQHATTPHFHTKPAHGHRRSGGDGDGRAARWHAHECVTELFI